jgi:hypothetical protein
MSDKTYNGWTNYETWLCNMHMFDGQSWTDVCGLDATDTKPDVSFVAECAEQMVKSYLDDDGKTHMPSLVSDILFAFSREVDYRQIAEHLLED